MNTHRATVLVLQRRLTHYRTAFFELLRTELARYQIRLVLACGGPAPDELSKSDGGRLGWAIHARNRYFNVGGRFIVWQSIPDVAIESVDLVILTQENRILSNFYHLFRRCVGGPRVAFWGHGANLQSDRPNGASEKFKKWTSKSADWWFAYTERSAELIMRIGFPVDRTTVVNNATDTLEMVREKRSVSSAESLALARQLGFYAGRVAVFVGSLYKDKQVDFLLDSCDRIRERLPDFHLMVIGAGDQSDMVRNWCASRTWARFLGPRFGREKALYLSIASILLNPGAVGLGVLDSFAYEIPLVTTRAAKHGPEIFYIVDGVNGVVVDGDLDGYVGAVISLLRNGDALARMKSECRLSAQEYTLEKMVGRFTSGILSALEIKA